MVLFIGRRWCALSLRGRPTVYRTSDSDAGAYLRGVSQIQKNEGRDAQKVSHLSILMPRLPLNDTYSGTRLCIFASLSVIGSHGFPNFGFRIVTKSCWCLQWDRLPAGRHRRLWWERQRTFLRFDAKMLRQPVFIEMLRGERCQHRFAWCSVRSIHNPYLFPTSLVERKPAKKFPVRSRRARTSNILPSNGESRSGENFQKYSFWFVILRTFFTSLFDIILYI